MDARSSYRETVARGASPVRLVICLYEQAIEDLRRAVIAQEKGDIEARTRGINHALIVVAQLQGSLDMERGGEVAGNLGALLRPGADRPGRGSGEAVHQNSRTADFSTRHRPRSLAGSRTRNGCTHFAVRRARISWPFNPLTGNSFRQLERLMPSLMLSRTENFRETNRRLVFFLDALPAKPGLQAVASPEHMAALLAELLRAGTELRAEPLPAKGSDPELDKALYEYRSHVERLRQLLPSILVYCSGSGRGSKPRELGYGPRQNGRAPPVRPCEQRPRGAFLPSSYLFKVIKQIVLRRSAHRFERCLQRRLGSGQVTDHRRQVGARDRGLLLRQLRGIAAKVSLLRVELVRALP